LHKELVKINFKRFFIHLYLIKLIMTDNSANPLDFENKLYDIEEFGAALRSKFEADNSISNVILAEIFLSKYPIYSCKIKILKTISTKKVLVVVKTKT